MMNLGGKSIPWNEGILYLGNGKVSNKNQNYGFSLIHYDLYGNKAWEKVYQFPAINSIKAISIGSFDGNYLYVAGNVIDNLNSDRFLCKLNLNGDTIFFKEYKELGFNRIVDLKILSPDSIVLLSAWKEQYNSEDIRTVVELVDANGVITKTTEDTLGIKNPVELIRHNDLLYVGGTLSINPDSLKTKVYISRYDLNLEHLGITTPSLTEREYFFCFTKTDEHLLFTSRVHMETQDHNLFRTNLSRVDQQGVLIDTNTFGPTDFSYYYASTTNIGNEFIATYVREDIPIVYFHDLQMNLLCNFLIDIPFNAPIFAVLENITALSSNLISGTGYIGYLTGSGVGIKQWNFLTEDMVTFIYNNCDLVILKENIQKPYNYRITQSFSNRTITVECLMNANSGNTELRFIDLNGRLVLSKEFKERTTINIQSLSKGLHILQLLNGGRFEVHKILIY